MSESIVNVSKALVAARAGFGPIKLSKTNPHFKSKYADLSGILGAIDDSLTKNGLTLSHRFRPCESGIAVATRLIHSESGESLENEIEMPVDKNSAQAVGSAITYGRRYGVAALLSLVADEDDDGNGAEKSGQNRKPQAKAQERPKGANAAPPSDAPQDEVPFDPPIDKAAQSELDEALRDLLRWTNERVSEGKEPWGMARLRKHVEAKALVEKRSVDAEYVREVLSNAAAKEAARAEL